MHISSLQSAFSIAVFISFKLLSGSNDFVSSCQRADIGSSCGGLRSQLHEGFGKFCRQSVVSGFVVVLLLSGSGAPTGGDNFERGGQWRLVGETSCVRGSGCQLLLFIFAFVVVYLCLFDCLFGCLFVCFLFVVFIVLCVVYCYVLFSLFFILLFVSFIYV